MTTKHTPGPWICGPFRETGKSAGIDIGASDNSNVALAIHQASDRTALETKRNARLIASAPELLSALESLLASYRRQWGENETTMVAHNAISKAKGE